MLGRDCPEDASSSRGTQARRDQPRFSACHRPEQVSAPPAVQVPPPDAPDSRPATLTLAPLAPIEPRTAPLAATEPLTATPPGPPYRARPSSIRIGNW